MLQHWLHLAQQVAKRDPSLGVCAWHEPDQDNSLTAFAVTGCHTAHQRRVFSGLKTLKLGFPTTKETKMATFQSRWGFHPCSYEFFLKLKKLNILCEKALRQMAASDRWHRKEPQNRRRFVGGKNGWEANTGDAVGQRKRDIPKMHRVYEPLPEPVYPAIDAGMIELVAADYKNARTPVVESQVKPLVLSEQKVNGLLRLLEMGSGTGTEGVTQAVDVS